VLHELGDVETARNLESTLRPTRDALGHFLLGTRALKEGHQGDQTAFDRALGHFTSAVVLSPRARRLLHFQRAHAARHAGDDRCVLECAEALRRFWPDSAMAQFWTGFALRRVRPEESISAYRRAIELDPGHDLAMINLAEFLLERGEKVEALRCARMAAAIAAHRPEAHDLAGQAMLATGDVDSASQAFEAALQVAPTYAGACAGLGLARERKGNLARAEAAFRKGVELDPRSELAHSNLGHILLRRGDAAGAVEALFRARSLAPGDARICCRLADALHKAGRRDEAGDAFEEASRLDPASAMAWVGLGSVRLDQDDAARAAEAFRRVLEILPSNAEARNNLGVALERAGDLPGAMDEWRHVLRESPGLPEAHSNLVRVLADAADHAALRQELERWAALHPTDARAHAALARHLLHVDRIEDLRDRPALVAASRRAVEASKNQDPALLLLLAQALEVAGERSPALETVRSALALLDTRPEPAPDLRLAFETLLGRLFRK
jgi:tetratricopeptide (TPR) repeat protein